MFVAGVVRRPAKATRYRDARRQYLRCRLHVVADHDQILICSKEYLPTALLFC